MKKKLIPVVLVLIIIFSAALLMFTGNTSIAKAFQSIDKKEIASTILEAQYKLSKNYNVLCELCTSLGAFEDEDVDEQRKKTVKYYEILLNDERTYQNVDNNNLTNDYMIYISSLYTLGDYEKFKDGCERLLEKTGQINNLTFFLEKLSKTGSEEDKKWVREFSKKILGGNYIKAHTQEELNEIKGKFESLSKPS